MPRNPDEPVKIEGHEHDFPSRAEREQLRELPNVRGHAIGRGENENGDRCGDVYVIVFVEEKVPLEELTEDERVPEVFCGCHTDVVERIPDTNIDDQRRSVLRPVTGGANIGGNGSGSVGVNLWDTEAEKPITTSAVHVLGDLEAPEDEMLGTDAYQPYNSHDDYHIGEVIKASNTANENQRSDICYVDPSTSRDSDPVTLSTRQFGMGEVVDVREPRLDERYAGSALNTGFTGGRVTAVDATYDIGGTVFHGLFELDGWTQGGDSGHVTGYVSPTGDIAATGSLIGSYVDDTGAFFSPLAGVDNDSGLSETEPLTGQADHTDHDLVSTEPAVIAEDLDGFLEATPRRCIYNTNSGQFDIAVLFANTGGTSVTSTFFLETQSGTTIETDTVSLDSAEIELRAYSIPSSYNETRLNAYTEDEAEVLANRDGQTVNRESFVVADDLAPPGYTETGPAAPSGLEVTETKETSMTVSWEHSPDQSELICDSYRIYLDGEYLGSVDDSSSSATISALEADQSYEIEIRAADRGRVESDGVTTTASTDERDIDPKNSYFARTTATLSGTDAPNPSDPSRAAARYNGELVAVTTTGTGQLEIDGEIIDPSVYPNAPEDYSGGGGGGGGGGGTADPTPGDPDGLDRRHGSVWIRHDKRGE